MAETGVAVAAARVAFIARLEAATDATAGSSFPRASLAVAGLLEDRLRAAPALDVEESFRSQLTQRRSRDAAAGGATAGPHRSDFTAHYLAKAMPAAQCSTGEQKALLIGIVLGAGQSWSRRSRAGPPVLLLDEVAAHLDEDRRAALFAQLLEMGGQVWLTGTDAGLFTALGGPNAGGARRNRRSRGGKLRR